MLTLRDRFGRLEGLKVAICGDILHSRVAREQHLGPDQARRRGRRVRPARRCCRANVHELGVTILPRIEDAIQWADALNVLRLQLERMQAGFLPSLREYNRVFGVTRERLARAPKDLLILHPGPMNRGVEIDSDVADGPHSVILPQVTNGVAVRMAVLYLLAGGSPDWHQQAGEGTERAADPDPRRPGGRPVARRPTRSPISTSPTARSQARGPRPRPPGRRAGRSRPPARSSRPGSSTCTCTCASRARRTSRPSPPARWPRRRAASPPSARCRTPIPVTDNQAAVGFIVQPGAAGGEGAGLSHRRDLAGPEGPAARRVRRAGRGRRRGGERRRQAGRLEPPDADRARVRPHLRHSGRRPLRGADARGRRRDARGHRLHPARPQGDPGGGRGDHGRAATSSWPSSPAATSISATCPPAARSS